VYIGLETYVGMMAVTKSDKFLRAGSPLVISSSYSS
jgi:hypothetical protein